MASAAEQLASNLNWGAIGKATELKKRLWFTVGALVVFRIGAYIPVPGVDPHALAEIFQQDAGRKKINQYTRYGTVILAAFQAYGIAVGLESQSAAVGPVVIDPGLFFRF